MKTLEEETLVEIRFTCGWRRYVFTGLVNMNQLNDEQEYECKWLSCGKVLKSAMECFEHCKTDHIPKGMLKCHWKDCSKVATIRSNLVSHLNKHITINSEFCFICDKSFRWRGDFRRHNKKHSDQEQKFNLLVNLLFK
jgi:hypothetical protein